MFWISVYQTALFIRQNTDPRLTDPLTDPPTDPLKNQWENEYCLLKPQHPFLNSIVQQYLSLSTHFKKVSFRLLLWWPITSCKLTFLKWVLRLKYCWTMLFKKGFWGLSKQYSFSHWFYRGSVGGSVDRGSVFCRNPYMTRFFFAHFIIFPVDLT